MGELTLGWGHLSEEVWENHWEELVLTARDGADRDSCRSSCQLQPWRSAAGGADAGPGCGRP